MPWYAEDRNNEYGTDCKYIFSNFSMRFSISPYVGKLTFETSQSNIKIEV